MPTTPCGEPQPKLLARTFETRRLSGLRTLVVRDLSVYELNHLVFSYLGFYHRCYSLLLSGFHPVIFRSLARDSTLWSLPCDSIGLGSLSQAEQIRTFIRCVCLYLVFLLDSIPFPLVFFAFFAPTYESVKIGPKSTSLGN